jgi:leucyl-tRNA synthetase
VNGRLRGHISIAVDAEEEAVRAAALAEPNAQKFIGVLPVRKVIIVPGKLVNVVV